MDIEQIIRDYIPGVIHLSLGTCANGRPWVCEVHFAYDEQLNLYFRSLATRRHCQEIAANPHVAGNIVRQHKLGEYPLGVYFEGVAQQVPAGSAQDEAAACLAARLKANAAEMLAEAAKPGGHQFYKIAVRDWYVFGKLDDEGGKKHHLTWNGEKQ